VLQTLALIQRNAEQPREVTRLARRQERELRTLLYGIGAPNGQLSAALQMIAAEVEDTYAVTIDVVVVGDHAMDARLEALVAAAREALVNAAKHAQVTAVSLYAEVDDGVAAVFVRDRGIGFDLSVIPDDRHGLKGSIIGRLERQRGSATIRTSPGDGTEIELRMATR
jgi:signal transduction histidine kinase